MNNGVPRRRRRQYSLVFLCGPDVSRAKAPSGARPMLPAGGQRPLRLPAGLSLHRPTRRLARANLSSVCRLHLRLSGAKTAGLFILLWVRFRGADYPPCCPSAACGRRGVAGQDLLQLPAGKFPPRPCHSGPASGRVSPSQGNTSSQLHYVTPKRLKDIPPTEVTCRE